MRRVLLWLCVITVPVSAGAATSPPQVREVFGVGSSLYVRSLLVDDDTLWVGTSGGVLEIDVPSRGLVNTFTRADGLANEYIFAIGKDPQGQIWFGTNAGGASRYDDGDWSVYFPMHGLADYWVYAFASQQSGDWWIGTWAGANHVDLDTMRFTTYHDELVNEWVYGIDVDSSDRVWFGTEGGVSMYDGDTWRHWTHADGLGASNAKNLPHSTNTGLGTRSRHDLAVAVDDRESYNPNYVFAVHVTPDDTVWAGTWGGGVARYSDGIWQNYTSADGLAGDIVYSIAEGSDGALWFGTNRGITRFHDGQWDRLGQAEGLPADDVYTLAAAPNGHIWAGVRGAVVEIATGLAEDETSGGDSQ